MKCKDCENVFNEIDIKEKMYIKKSNLRYRKNRKLFIELDNDSWIDSEEVCPSCHSPNISDDN